MARAVRAGVTRVAFGDLFLEDIRRYRMERLEGTGLTPLFPLWGIPTNDLARRMIEGDFARVSRAWIHENSTRALLAAISTQRSSAISAVRRSVR